MINIDSAAWASPWRARAVGDKALLCLGMTCAGLALPALPASPMVLVVAVLLALGPARVPGRVLLRAAGGPAAFIVLAAAPVAVTVQPGDGSPLAVTTAGVARAAELALHGLAGSAAVLLLAVTTPMADLLAGLVALRVPAAVVEVAMLTYRMLFSLLDSARAIRAAQAARLGYATRRAALRSAAGLTTAVLTRALDRAHRLDDGLAGRGATGALTVPTTPVGSSPRFVAATVAGLVVLVAVGLVVPGAKPVPW